MKAAAPTTAFCTGILMLEAAGMPAAIRIATSAIMTPRAPMIFTFTAPSANNFTPIRQLNKHCLCF